MKRVETLEEYQASIAADEWTVIKFDTTWCPDCKNLDRWIDEVIANHPDKRFLSMDAEKFQEVAESNQVRGIPSLLIFRNGEKVAHLHSKFAKTPAQVQNYLETMESQA